MSVVKLVARSPTRIDLAGGYTDLIPFAGKDPGAVVNAAIDLQVHVALEVVEQVQEKIGIDVEAADFGVSFRVPYGEVPVYDGSLDLLKAIVHYMNVPEELSLSVRSDAPAQGGLGSSGAVGVVLVGILDRYTAGGRSRFEIANVANRIERAIGVCCGKQDHYASALGGINYMEFTGEEVQVTKIVLTPAVIRNLTDALCLCYTGLPRFARGPLQNTVDSYHSGNVQTIDALANLRRIAFEMHGSLVQGDLVFFGELLRENWSYQKNLHPSVSSSSIDSLFELAYSNGAIGGKACGAGGGGCLIFCCESGMKSSLQAKLEDAGARVLDFAFDFNGLEIWEPQEE